MAWRKINEENWIYESEDGKTARIYKLKNEYWVPPVLEENKFKTLKAAKEWAEENKLQAQPPQ